MQTILITNDDGINSDGLLRLATAARAFGNVWVVAPESQRSAAAHSITLHSPIDVNPYDFPVEGVKAFTCSGTPGDCVRVGSLYIMDTPPDVVLSGINFGYNVGSDIQYSATAGAAFEASFQGFLGIALSEAAGACHEVTDAYLPIVLEKLIGSEKGYDGQNTGSQIPGEREHVMYARDQIINVNFPGCALQDCRGILESRAVSESMVYEDRYNLIEKLPGEGLRLMVEGIYHAQADAGTDFRALLDNYVSIGKVRNIG